MRVIVNNFRLLLSRHNEQKGGIKRWKVSVNEQILILNQLSFLLKSNIPLVEALSIIGGGNSKIKPHILGLKRELENGESFSQIICHSGLLPPAWRGVLQAGELSGNLHFSCKTIAEHLSIMSILKKKILSALYYPLFVASFAGLAVIFLVTYVLPKITPVLESSRIPLPLLTEIILKMSHVLKVYWWMGILFSIIFILTYTWFIKSEKRKEIFHKQILKIPIIGRAIFSYNLCSLYMTILLMNEAGYSLQISLKAGGESCSNIYFKNIVSDWSQLIIIGQSLSHIMKQRKELSIDSSVILSAENSGSLDEALKYLGEFHQNSVNEFIKKFSSIIEPVFLIIVGLIVSLIALAVLLPIYKMTGSMSG